MLPPRKIRGGGSNKNKEEENENNQEDCRHNALGYDGIGNV